MLIIVIERVLASLSGKGSLIPTWIISVLCVVWTLVRRLEKDDNDKVDKAEL